MTAAPCACPALRLRALPQALLASLALASLAWPQAQAAALTDGSTGAVQSLQGTFTVPQALGTVRGANLFHSFTRFGVAAGESATFTTSDAGIRHVISRVTGGDASLINGPVSLQAATGASPSFWLVNPSGIVVGPGAQFDVPAGLHLATAQQLRFGDGSRWDSGRATASSLSMAAPDSFGFLGPAAALRWQQAQAVLRPGATFELAAGELQLSAAAVSAGQVRLQAQGALQLDQGSFVLASAPPGDTRPVLQLAAGQLALAGQAALLAYADVGAAAGSTGVDVQVSGDAVLREGSAITQLNASAQTPGPLQFKAGSLTLDGSSGGGGLVNLLTQTTPGSSGGAGALQLQVAGALTLLDGGQIGSDARGSGPSGALQVQAGSLLAQDRIGNTSPGLRNGALSGAVGVLDLRVDGALQVLGGASIASYNSGGAAAGPLTVAARSVVVEGGGGTVLSSSIGAIATGAGRAADVSVNASERVALGQSGQITSTSGGGTAGSGHVRVSAPLVQVRGVDGLATTIASAVLAPDGGPGGQVTVQADTLQLQHMARIWSVSSSDTANAGDVHVSAARISIDGQGSSGGIQSFARGDGGSSGRITVEARESLDLKAGGIIDGLSLGRGSTGEVTVNAGTVRLDARGAGESYTGIGGDALGAGAAAPVTVRASLVEVLHGARISSSTYSAAPAGAIRIEAGTLRVDGGANSAVTTGVIATTADQGPAGSISVLAGRVELRDEGVISSTSYAAGTGGPIHLQADALQMTGTAGIYSLAAGTGAAGPIDVAVRGDLQLTGGAGIAANTGGSGAAGRVTVSAASAHISGHDAATGLRSRIISRAVAGSGGQAGSLALDVAGSLLLDDQALLSVANQATLAPGAVVQPSQLVLRAGRLVMSRGAEITAAATANADAGQLNLVVQGEAQVQDSLIRTSSLDGNGGAITLQAGGALRLRNARITTSVDGQVNGNGGDIGLQAAALLMQSGFVQANTAAPAARGGRVTIHTPLLVPDGSQVLVGGNRIEAYRAQAAGFNVIQAAAPDGVGGTLAVTVPQLDLAASLARLVTPRVALADLARDVCERPTDPDDTGAPPSTLRLLGRGALRPSPLAPLGLVP